MLKPVIMADLDTDCQTGLASASSGVVKSSPETGVYTKLSDE